MATAEHYRLDALPDAEPTTFKALK